MLLVVGGIAVTPLASAWAQYKPPARGAPGGRIGGASRSTATPAAELPVLEVLAPEDHAGVTARPDPILYYFVSRPSRWPLQLTIAAPHRPAPVLDVPIPAPAAGGIYPLPLAQYHVHLDPGIDYTWSVSVVIDPHAWSHNVVASAAIVFDPTQAASLPGIRAAGAADLAAAGLWYDAVAATGGASTTDGRRLLASLLQQVGLGSVVAADRGTPMQ